VNYPFDLGNLNELNQVEIEQIQFKCIEIHSEDKRHKLLLGKKHLEKFKKNVQATKMLIF